MKEEFAAAVFWPRASGEMGAGDALMVLMRRVLRAGVEALRGAECTVSFEEPREVNTDVAAARRKLAERGIREAAYGRNLLSACQSGDSGLVMLLLTAGAGVDAKDECDRSLLSVAAGGHAAVQGGRKGAC